MSHSAAISNDWHRIFRLWRWITVAFVMLMSTAVASVLLYRLWTFEMDSRGLQRDLIARQVRMDYEAIAEETYLKLDTLAIRAASIEESLHSGAKVEMRFTPMAKSAAGRGAVDLERGRAGRAEFLARPTAALDSWAVPLWFGDLYLGELSVACTWGGSSMTATAPRLLGLMVVIVTVAVLFWFLVFSMVNRLVFQPLVRKATALSKSASMVHTAQMLAHDIKRPFSMLSSALEIMRRRDAETDADAVDRMVRSAVRSVDAMLADIMDLGREQVLSHDHVSLRTLVRSALDMLFPDGVPPHIEVRVALRHRHKLWADEQRLSRVLLNLLENAVQAIGDQPAVLSIESRDGVTFTVHNTGSYIDEAQRRMVFEPFFTKGKRHGRGLGLTIVQRIVQAHGGEIVCRSDPEHGTEFECRIPASDLLDLAAEPEAKASSAAAPLQAVVRSAEVMIIEDDPFFSDALFERLRGDLRGEPTISAFSGPWDLQKWLAAREDGAMAPLCIVMDMSYSAGEPDGIELAERLREIWPSSTLILTSDSADYRREEYEALGYWRDVLAKDLDLVVEATEKALA